jgi:hypothetical protein
MGVTAHWIEGTANPGGEWKLCSEVIAFKGILGSHTGENLGRYFLGLCKRVGIINSRGSKVRHLL